MIFYIHRFSMYQRKNKMNINKELLKGSTSIIVLSLLNNKDMYGYEIIQQMKKNTNDLFIMKEGTLYPMLHSLEKDGAVESYWYDTDEGRRRKYYRITENGRKILNIKKKEWRVFSTVINNIIGMFGEDKCYE